MSGCVILDSVIVARKNGKRLPCEVLKAENEKLRKLVRHLHECLCNIDADGNHECYSCDYYNEEGECDFERLMSEMGVEAD